MTLVFCGCVFGRIISAGVREMVLTALRDAQIRHIEVRDLCELAAKHDPLFGELERERDLTIIACYPRAVRGLFRRVGAKLPENTHVLNMREETGEEILRHLGMSRCETSAPAAMESPTASEWVPWFPVIDYDRCSNCKQCLNFCLFGVYELSSCDRVEVRNPERCKTNCPACARICPQAAIMFPKCDQKPINGAEIEDEVALQAVIRVNVQQILGNDVYKALAERRKRYRRTASDNSKNASPGVAPS